MTLVGMLKLTAILVLVCLFLVCVWAGLKVWLSRRYEKGKAVPRTLRSLFLEPNLTIKEGVLIYDTSKDLETIDIKNLKQIEYHYVAVAGFLSVWEFKDKDGKSIKIDGETKGLQTVLKQLERTLPEFSMETWQFMFDRGDFDQDSIVVWSAA